MATCSSKCFVHLKEKLTLVNSVLLNAFLRTNRPLTLSESTHLILVLLSMDHVWFWKVEGDKFCVIGCIVHALDKSMSLECYRYYRTPTLRICCPKFKCLQRRFYILWLYWSYFLSLLWKRHVNPIFTSSAFLFAEIIVFYQGCELDRFLSKFKFEFKRYLQVRVQVRVLRILFFEFGKNDRVQRVQVWVQVRVRSPGMNK